MQFLAEGEKQSQGLILAHLLIRLESALLHMPKKWIARFTAQLKKGVNLRLGKEDLLRICQIFQRHHFMDLLLYYAKYAAKRFPENPMFIFYLVFAKTKGGEKRLNRTFVHLLEDAFDDAMEEGDKAAAKIIDDFLNKTGLNFGMFGDFFPPKKS